MERQLSNGLPRIEEPRYDSSNSLNHNSSNSRHNSGRTRTIEDRLDQMENDIKTTHQMLRELGVLVHRQLQFTARKNKNRSLSENIAPTSYHVFAGGNSTPLRGFAGLDPSRLDPTRLVPTESTDTDHSRTESIPDLKVGALKTDDRTRGDPGPAISSLEKQDSPPLAVQEPTQSAKWVLEKEDDDTENAPREASSTVTPVQSRKRNFLHAKKRNNDTEVTSRDIHALTWRFSVSSINMAQQQQHQRSTFKKIRKHPAIPERQTGSRSSVTPEEIMLARKINGEVDPYTLRHDSQVRTMWDVFVMMTVLLDIIFTPISVGFNYKSWFLDTFDLVEPIIFLTDFFVRMFSSYIDAHGALISGPRQTVPHYFMSGWVIPDVLSWFPFEVFVQGSHSAVLGFMKIFRLAKVSNLAHKVHSAAKAGLVRLILLLGIVLTISHLLACYWGWVADVWREHLPDGSFVPTSLFDEYSLCWSLAIGALNASPPTMYTAVENISIACFMLIGNILQASVFGSVAALIASFDENEAAYSKKIIATSERCRFLGISDKLAKRIRGYYENLWRETKSINSDADSFINELSPALICEVKFQLYRDMMKRIPFLSAKTLAPAIIEMLILHLRTVIYMQDDVLIRKGEFGDWMGFIGSKGSVGVLDPNCETCEILCILRKGDYFGEMALLQHTKRSATAVALTWVQIHVLCRQDLDYVKELYPTQAQVLESEISKYKRTQSGATRSP